jgi:thermitase
MTDRVAGGVRVVRFRFGAFLGLVLLAALTATGTAQAAPLTPSDPLYGTYQWYGAVMGMPAAWGVSTGSSSVKIAIVDSGVVADMPDLVGRVLPAQAPTGVPILDGYDFTHGTRVASVAAMGVNNGIGGAGVGNFSILPITATDYLGHNASADVANAIRLAADSGARVINVSMSTLTYGSLDAAAAYARSKGALTFVAAGNDKSVVDYSAYTNLIFVSGTDATDQLWSSSATVGSSHGLSISLAAPASNIVVADPNSTTGYYLSSGTSYSAAFASGAAALAWSINPNLTPDQVQSLLYGTAVDLGTPGWDPDFGYGRLNMAGVAQGAEAMLPEPATLTLLLVGGVAAVIGRRKGRQTRN